MQWYRLVAHGESTRWKLWVALLFPSWHLILSPWVVLSFTSQQARSCFCSYFCFPSSTKLDSIFSTTIRIVMPGLPVTSESPKFWVPEHNSVNAGPVLKWGATSTSWSELRFTNCCLLGGDHRRPARNEHRWFCQRISSPLGSTWKAEGLELGSHLPVQWPWEKKNPSYATCVLETSSFRNTH